jgi:hypothetical protein
MAGEAAASAASAPVDAPGEGVEATQDTPAETKEPRAQGGEPAEKKPAPKPPPRKAWRVGEREVTDPDELYAIAEQNRVERKLVEETAQESKRNREFLRLLKEDPRAVLSDPSIGHDLKKLAIDWLKEQIEEEGLSPEQKRIKELERSLKQREEQEKTAKQKAEAEAQEKADNDAREYLVKVITDAMAEVKLPKTDAIDKQRAQLMLKQTALGLDLPPAAIARLVEREVMEEHASIYDEMDGAEVLRRFPKLADKVRKAHLESLKIAPATAPVEGGQEAHRLRSVKEEPFDFRKAQREIMQNLKR